MTEAKDVTLNLIKPGRQIEHRGIRYSRRTVTIDREWEVILDGEVIGWIQYRLLTREQRTPGRMYVNRRWQTPGWEYRTRSRWSRGLEVSSKKNAIERIIRDHEQGI